MLPEICSKNDIGRLSGNGWALGYVGGLLLLFISLLFFAENDKIDHVAISLGKSKIIHCSGFVKEESLKSTDSDYNMKLNTKFYGAISIEELS